MLWDRPLGLTENQLRDKLVSVLTGSEAASLAFVGLLRERAGVAHLATPEVWTGETSIKIESFRVDAVGWTATGAATVVIEAKLGARFLDGQAWAYADWQRDNLADETVGVLAYLAPSRRVIDIPGYVATDMLKRPHEREPAVHFTEGRAASGGKEIATAVVSWDEVVECLWLAAQHSPDTLGRVLDLWDECAVSVAADPRLVTSSTFLAWSEGDRAAYLGLLTDAVVTRAAKQAGVREFKRNPASRGLNYGFHYLLEGAAWFAVGVREGHDSHALSVRASLTNPGARRFADRGEVDGDLVWIGVAIEPQPTVVPTVDHPANFVAELIELQAAGSD